MTTAILSLCLALVAAIRLAGAKPVEALCDGLNRAGELSGRIDPNSAPWWELSHLPGIGETRARRIVSYRESIQARRGSSASIVFYGPADLTKVEGIGPKIAEQASTQLAFPQPSPKSR